MTDSKIIGRVLATEKAPTTIDNFAFWTNPTLILNPFDIVKVEHVNGSFSYGMIEDISHITDAASFLTNYISSDFGDVGVESPMCDELAANIYSFPMKYHPINDPEFFMNRDFIGKHWNRKFIRAIQAVLNSTKGKVGKGKTFFEEAFGADEHRFWTILWMPETFIIYRFMFKDNLAKEWEEKFWSLPADKLKTVQEIVALNQFKELDMSQYDEQVRDVLTYYQFTRDEAEELIKQSKTE